MITTREAEATDAEALVIVEASGLAILRRTYSPKPETLAKRSERTGKRRRIVALRGEKLIGTAEFYSEGNGLCVMGLMVHHDHHRQGVARAILRSLEAIAARNHQHFLLARTIKETGNVRIFEKLGFKVVSEQPDTLFQSDDFSSRIEVTLEKRIYAEPETAGRGGGEAKPSNAAMVD